MIFQDIMNSEKRFRTFVANRIVLIKEWITSLRMGTFSTYVKPQLLDSELSQDAGSCWIIKSCVVCRRNNWTPNRLQRQASLSKDRVTCMLAPFSSTGVDCFGAFLVKVGRSRVKQWGCLFTCNGYTSGASRGADITRR
ncbi:hypothetical protein O3P69_009896 [Scylla paramamosain]|uniref:Uncharacterized protein n=1 Tax=Scylla paramamosain TaxID=85552 RepID=A0AAW0SNP0_SCYPA